MPIERARAVLSAAARTILNFADTLTQKQTLAFERIVDELTCSDARVILTGMGKSGIICRKIAATLASTGTPAYFLHPAEAIHGDLGMVMPLDRVIAISNSGETPELIRLITHIKRQGACLIAISAQEESTLVQQADHALTFTVDEEGCPLGLAPMASTTATLAIGDALAAAIMERKHFSAQDFARFHPGGKLGHALLKISDVMHAGQEKPLVAADSTLEKALLEMTEKRLGMTVVFLAEKTYGLLSDGDIRRLLQQQGSLSLQRLAGEVCTRNPRTLREDQLAVEALNVMETHHITSVVILNRQGHYVGVVHLHDLWKTQMI